MHRPRELVVDVAALLDAVGDPLAAGAGVVRRERRAWTAQARIQGSQEAEAMRAVRAISPLHATGVAGSRTAGVAPPCCVHVPVAHDF